MSRKYVYWISTALLCLLYLASATFYVIQGDKVRQVFGSLGYPTRVRSRTFFAHFVLFDPQIAL